MNKLQKLTHILALTVLLVSLALPFAAHAQEATAEAPVATEVTATNAEPEVINSRGGSVFVLLIGATAIVAVGALTPALIRRQK